MIPVEAEAPKIVAYDGAADCPDCDLALSWGDLAFDVEQNAFVHVDCRAALQSMIAKKVSVARDNVIGYAIGIAVGMVLLVLLGFGIYGKGMDAGRASVSQQPQIFMVPDPSGHQGSLGPPVAERAFVDGDRLL